MAIMSDMLRDFVKDTTEKIVDKPDEVDVKTTISTKAVIIQVRVHNNDCGKIIGRHGRTIDALKVLCLAIKNTQFPSDSRRVMLEVLEDENSQFNYNQ
jgi:predicted RNA-binding protein YlqC (UPF0109 family)